MALKQLIDGQTILIDNHCRGAEFKWGKGVHLHKSMDRDKFSGAEVLIPLYEDANDQQLDFRNLRGENQAQIKNEIKDAFKDKGIRNRFIHSFYKALDEILKKERISRIERIDIAKKATSHIAELFGLKTKIKDSLKKEADKYYIKFGREDGDDFQVMVDFKDQSFMIGGQISDMETFETYR
ncbi:hypothetical protein [Bacteroides cellulosilyticus]|uniref:Uncharacterized protein n=1 Tax=Bacteroides cellulosilyticus TaxID=246787 RepID=A0AAW8VGL9_9BACE|nr:hypothetical protein [Bacteroides cellulosilyticus]MDT4511857.1 hypothetical protein [Bacteroides cellulosilyticus]